MGGRGGEREDGGREGVRERGRMVQGWTRLEGRPAQPLIPPHSPWQTGEDSEEAKRDLLRGVHTHIHGESVQVHVCKYAQRHTHKQTTNPNSSRTGQSVFNP